MEAPQSTFRIIFSDVDETIAHRGAVPESTRQLLARLRTKGTLFTVATGRLRGSITGLRLPITAPIVTEGGARVIHHETNETLVEHPVDPISLEWLVGEVHAGRLTSASYGMNGELPYQVFVRPGTPTPPRFLREASTFLSANEFATQLVRDRPPKVNFRWGEERATIPLGVNIAINEGSADLLAPGVSKATAVAWVLEYLGVKPEHAVVMGNDHNDLPMLTMRGVHAIAVGDLLPPETLINVRRRAPTPDDLAEILQQDLAL